MAIYTDFTSYTSVIFVTIISLLALHYLNKWMKHMKFRLPPGPAGWPFLGYIEFVFAEKPSKLLLQANKEYGNIFGFYVGNQYCVVLADFLSVKECFSKKEFLSRPPKYLRSSPFCKNFSQLEGVQWEKQRKFFTSCLSFLGLGKNRFEEIVHDELSRVIPKMESFVGKAECNIRDLISSSLNNTIMQLICSQWLEDDHHVMKSLNNFQALLAESFSNNIAFIYFPWLDWISEKFHPFHKTLYRSSIQMVEFVRSEIKYREKTHNENSTHDYIDLYLNEMKTGKHGMDYFSVEHLISNCTLLLMAGADTTRGSLEWLLMSMAAFPEIQDQVYSEIVSNIGTEKLPSFADKTCLPYTEATVLESERWKTLAPLNVLRWTNEDTVVRGFGIPKNTVILNHLDNCHMDPEYWENPKVFIPERFLSKDKTRIMVPEYFMPFSLGKRNCPGDKMATIEIFIYFTSIMQRFKLLPPDGGVTFESKHRISRQPLKPVVRIEPR